MPVIEKLVTPASCRQLSRSLDQEDSLDKPLNLSTICSFPVDSFPALAKIHPMDAITLYAPLSGRLMPLEAIPDPVFARRMAGEGIALDPVSNTLLAPCDGQIINLHPGSHALTIANNSIEITIHIGLGTAELAGEGFLAHVQTGDQVITGQRLIEFDPDYVAARAASLITVILIANPERLDEVYKSAGDVQGGQDVLMELLPVDQEALISKGIFKPIVSEAVTVPNHSGLHFRPAAVLASLCRGFKSDLKLIKGNQEANAKSVSAVMALDIGNQEEVRLSAAGPDAYEAINILVPAIINGLGEEGSTPIQAPASIILPAIAARLPRPHPDDPRLIQGKPATPGLALGYSFLLRPGLPEIVETASDPQAERERLDRALAQTRLQLEALRSRTLAESNPSRAALIAAQHELLDDPHLLDSAYGAVERGKSAEFAWLSAANDQAQHLEQLENELLQTRADDLRAVGRRVACLITAGTPEIPHFSPGSIVIAEHLPPATLANLEPAKVQGVATVLGGPFSELADLARSMGLPLVTGIETRVLEVTNGTSIILDGAAGTLHLDPAAEEMSAARERIKALAGQRQEELTNAFKPAETAGGHRLTVEAMISSVEQAQQAMQKGGNGVCWLTTEHLFLGRRTAPTEDEQAIAYMEIANSLAPAKPLTIRTFNNTGQQPLPYLPQAPDPNPALGLRGLRFTLEHPQLLRKQCRAILSAAAETGRPLQILLPMVSAVDQFRCALDLIATEQEKMEIEPVPVGLLIQVPAVAIAAAKFAREADFLVLDANDLAQYTLAMDSRHPHLAEQLDTLDPAVLQLIHLAAKGAAEQETPLTISGAIAADPLAVPILVGLGVSGLSVPPSAIPQVKAQIASLNLEACQNLAQKALAQDTAAQVRALASSGAMGDTMST